jgi:hypothetical protein
MIGREVFDDRSHRYDGTITSARAHPELLVGELAMHPRIHVKLSDADRKTNRKWGASIMIALILVVSAAFLLPASRNEVAGASPALADGSNLSAGLPVPD